MRKHVTGMIFALIITLCSAFGQGREISDYNIVWTTTQSSGSHESMPCGGGDIGLNVWVENDEVLFYFSKSGSFDENNTFLKSGRIRLKTFPDIFREGDFSQKLNLEKGSVEIKSNGTSIEIWVDIFRPVIHMEIESPQRIRAEVCYENWRYQDRLIRKGEGNQNSYKWVIPEGLMTKKDGFDLDNNSLHFYHKNQSPTIFDATVALQGLDSVKSQLFNPLENLVSGGKLWSDQLRFDRTGTGEYAGTEFHYWAFKSVKPAKSQRISIALHNEQTENLSNWKKNLNNIAQKPYSDKEKKATQQWWKNYWNRSFVVIDKNKTSSQSWEIGRNYQLFRYMLGCNAYGTYPTKFNGGLFTFDPGFVDSLQTFTPDYRKWGGGTFTAQNQRLVYFPMLKSGDFDMMKSQFDYYLRLLKNAELRSKTYWGHNGACFTEQMENFGLPNPSEYGWKRPDYFDKGVEYNAWLEYQWDTVLEFCLMILETNLYADNDISAYIPMIESCLTFFDEHYTWQAQHRGRKSLDENGHLILYPGTACETYKMAYNATQTVAGLKVVLERLIELKPSHQKEKWEKMLMKIPPVEFRNLDDKEMIAPAKLWERVNNVEAPQLYPVFPWRIYGVGKSDLTRALNTYKYDPDMLKFRSHVGWKQDNIFAACLGLTEEAKRLTLLKMGSGPFRFPAFWGPGFDWAPDHNWGGSGMIGIQEMLIQTNEDKILLLPAWPKEWDVHFKLHVTGNTTVEAEFANGKLINLVVSPASRTKDIVNRIQE